MVAGPGWGRDGGGGDFLAGRGAGRTRRPPGIIVLIWMVSVCMMFILAALIIILRLF